MPLRRSTLSFADSRDARDGDITSLPHQLLCYWALPSHHSHSSLRCLGSRGTRSSTTNPSPTTRTPWKSSASIAIGVRAASAPTPNGNQMLTPPRHRYRTLPPPLDAPHYRLNLHPRLPLPLPPAILRFLPHNLPPVLPLATPAGPLSEAGAMGLDGYPWNMVGGSSA